MKNSLHLIESQVISQAGDPIIVVDNDLRVVYLNPAAERQYEIASQNAIGRHLKDLYSYQWESPQLETAALSALEKDGVWRGENIHLTQGGKKIYVESNVSRLRNKNGEKIGTLAVIRDITEQKIQAQIRQAHHEFLNRVGTTLACLSDPEQIMQAMGESIGRYLQVSRVFFVEIREAEGLSIVLYDWHEEGMESAVGAYRISEYADESFLQSLLRKENYIMRDTATDLRTSAQRFAALKLGAAINIPYISDGRLKYVLAIGHPSARDWRTDEIDLMTELTARLWPAIERAQAERALRESEKRFHIMADLTPVMIWVTDADGGIQFINRTYHEFFGRTENEVLGPNWQPLVHPDDFEQYKDAFLRASHEQVPFHAIARVRRADGEWRWIESFAKPRLSNKGLFLGMVGSSLDITEKLRVENELRASEARLRYAAQASGFGFYDFDVAAGRSHWTDELYQLMGVVPGTLVTLDIIQELVHADDRERVRAAMRAALDPAGTGEFKDEFRIVRPDTGEIRWFFNRGQTIFAGEQGDRKPIRSTGVMVDITDRKRTEEERDRLLENEKRARESAEAATRAKDDFLAIISHELRSPLNAILGYNRLVLAKSGDPELIKKSCGVIDRNARIQMKLIEDLLDTARIINGKLRIEPAPIDMTLILTDAIAVAQPAADAKRLTLQTCLNSTQNVVLGDRARLQQVVVNLLSNAIKFTPAGGRIELRTDCRDGRLCIAVQDTGVGIEPEFLPHVFEQFRQADTRSSARRQGGLGLGLSLVRHLVEMHGGEITARSDGPGQGATFQVLLPVGE